MFSIFKKIRLKRKQRQEIKKKMRMFHTRAKELENAMDHLISEHMTPSSIEELYSYINYYVQCGEDWENDYCKGYIRKKVYKGYLRYDNERL